MSSILGISLSLSLCLVSVVACSNAQPASPGTSGNPAGTSANVTGTTGTGTSGTNTTGATTTTGVGGGSSSSTGSGESSSTGATVTGSTTGAGGTGGTGVSTVVPGAESFNCDPADGSEVNTKLTHLVGGLKAPVGVYGPPGETDRLFVPLLGGRIEIVRGNSVTGTFLDISDRIDIEDAGWEERGLLGMAFHPDFQQNGKFFVIYTTGSPDDDSLTEVISEFTASGDSVDPSTERVFFQLPQPEINHNGGGMAIGLDGYLYVGVGDGGWSGEVAPADQYGNGQNPSTPLGALLRFTLDGQPAPDNMPGAAAEVWDIGLRNPWRVTADGCTGDLYIADVGYEGEHTAPPTEEVNVEPPRSGHNNYGWPIMEGENCRESGCDMSPFLLPTDSYPTLSGGAIIGGYVYRGSNIPGLRGTYLYADYLAATFWAFEYQSGVAANHREITSDINPDTFNTGLMISFGQDSAGEMYLIAWTDGGVEGMDGEPAPVNIGDLYRIDPE